MIEAALAAGKHVLSQKPFVRRPRRRRAALRPRRRARACGSRSTRTAAGRRTSPGCARRCAPGLIGAVHVARHRDPLGPRLDRRHRRSRRSTTSSSTTSPCTGSTSWRASASARPRSTPPAPAPPGRPSRPPLLAQAIVAFDGGQAALGFDGAARFGAEDRTCVGGSAGTLVSDGPEPRRAGGHPRRPPRASPGRGSKAPGSARASSAPWASSCRRSRTAASRSNGARGNLDALALVFAAIASSARGVPVAPGEVRSLAEARG